jgi:chitin-binding protein
MSVRRSIAGAAAAAGIAGAVGLWPAVPAAAHGAPTNPISRAYACTESDQAAGPACRAARAANRGQFGSFDYLRVPSVAGRDRQVIPDGRLCSAGLPEWRGIDLPRADWPATRLAAGGPLDISYRATIPHRGTFRIFLTRDGYDPGEPLTWAALDDKPLLTVTDPALRGDGYRLTGRLPANRTGRHLLYTVWQNADTPDTYYSCSDLVLTSAADRSSPASGANRPSATPEASAVAGQDGADDIVFGPGPVVAQTEPRLAVAVLAGASVGLGVLVLLRLRTARGGSHRQVRRRAD